MDDIYDNLENYEDVNDVTELKNENKELKLKLEEHSRTMNQLQKDFDKLNSEYNKLQFNYSSLLLTARAEIERKGEIIKTLNIEKDKLIISALQSKGKHMTRNSNTFSGNQKFSKDQNNYANADKHQQKQNHIESKDHFCGNKVNRLDTGASLLSTNPNVENKTISKPHVDKLLNVNKLSVNIEMKENITKNSHKDDMPPNKTHLSQRISNRRKSMPSFQEAKFSSDEETDESYLKTISRSPPRSFRHDSRNYRTDLLHSHGSSDSSRSRNSNNVDYNIQKYNEYEIKRHHKNYSPERHQSKYSDYNRQRLLKSPPSDKYNRSKSRDRRHNYERESHHDRHRQHEHSSLKHKIRNNLDEPSSKRPKTEIYSKCPSQDSNYISDREKEFSDRRHVSEPESKFEQFSCLSPEYNDRHCHQHLIKEIRDIAATTLEDPRISCEKYVLQSYNDHTFLVIPSARNADIKYIDSSSWGVEKVEVPEALKNKPFSTEGCSTKTKSKDYLSEIYDNIEDDQSIESGEIQSLEDDVILPTKKCEKQNNLDLNIKGKNSNTTDTGQKINISKARHSDSSTSGHNVPKMKKPHECSKKLEKNTREVVDNVDVMKIMESNKKPKEPDTKLKQLDNKNKDTLENATLKLENANSNRQSILDKMIQENMRTVEGDLELSDEESDTMEFQKDIEGIKVNVENSQTPSVAKEIEKSCINSRTEGKKEANVLENQVVNNDKHETTEKGVKEKTTSSKKSSSKDSSRESGKKHRSKKKSESKETSSKDHSKDKKDKKKSSEKSSKRNVPEQTVSKFSDLFGDTSSLITPDDLGIPTSDTNVKQDVKYSSMFENTQDAMDINVENVAEAQVESTNTDFNAIIETSPKDKRIDGRNIESSNNIVPVSKCEEADNEDRCLNDNDENSKVEASVDTSNIVKTVIISTGLQPQREIDNKFPELPVLNIEKNNKESNIKKDTRNVNVNALATSTPYKSVLNDEKMVSSQDSNTINANNISMDLSSSNVNNSSTFNTNSYQTEDVPDVRIVVRRRRKVIRKPT